jgi:hypothetical protein
MIHNWFRTRGYRHFDAPVGTQFAERICTPAFVIIRGYR